VESASADRRTRAFGIVDGYNRVTSGEGEYSGFVWHLRASATENRRQIIEAFGEASESFLLATGTRAAEVAFSRWFHKRLNLSAVVLMERMPGWRTGKR